MTSTITIFQAPEYKEPVFNKDEKEIYYETLKKQSAQNANNIDAIFQLEKNNKKLILTDTNILSILLKHVLLFCKPIVKKIIRKNSIDADSQKEQISKQNDPRYSVNVQLDFPIKAKMSPISGKRQKSGTIYQTIAKDTQIEVIGVNIPDVINRINGESETMDDLIDTFLILLTGKISYKNFANGKFILQRPEFKPFAPVKTTEVLFTNEQNARNFCNEFLEKIKWLESYYNTGFPLVISYINSKAFSAEKAKFFKSTGAPPYFQPKSKLPPILNILEPFYSGSFKYTKDETLLYGLHNSDLLSLYYRAKYMGLTNSSFKDSLYHYQEKFNNNYEVWKSEQKKQVIELEMLKKQMISKSKFDKKYEELNLKQKKAVDLEYKRLTNRKNSSNKLISGINHAIYRKNMQILKKIMASVPKQKDPLMLNDYIKVGSEKLCPHTYYRATETLKNTLNIKTMVESFAMDIDDVYYCKICGEELSMQKTGDSFTVMENYYSMDTDDRLQSAIWREATHIINSYLLFKYPTNIRNIIKAVVSIIYTKVEQKEVDLGKIRTTTGSIDELLSIYTAIYIFAVCAQLIYNNYGKITYSIRRKVGAKQKPDVPDKIVEQNILSNTYYLILKYKNVALTNTNIISKDNIKSILIDSYKWINNREKTVIKNKEAKKDKAYHETDPTMELYRKMHFLAYYESKAPIKGSANKSNNNNKSDNNNKSSNRNTETEINNSKFIVKDQESQQLQQESQQLQQESQQLQQLQQTEALEKYDPHVINPILKLDNSCIFDLKSEEHEQTFGGKKQASEVLRAARKKQLEKMRGIKEQTKEKENRVYKRPDKPPTADYLIKDIQGEFDRFVIPPEFGSSYHYDSFVRGISYAKDEIYKLVAAPPDPKLKEFEDKYKHLVIEDKKRAKQQKWASLRPVFNTQYPILWHKLNYTYHYINLASIYCIDGGSHNYDKFVLQQGKKFNLIDRQYIKDLYSSYDANNKKHREEIQKLRNSTVVKIVCGKCHGKKTNNKIIKQLLDKKEKQQTFFDYYKSRCPKSNLHDFDKKQCKNCGMIANEQQQSYYQKYKKDFEEVMNKSLNILSNKSQYSNKEKKLSNDKSEKIPKLVESQGYILGWAKMAKVPIQMIQCIGLYEKHTINDIKKNSVNYQMEEFQLQRILSLSNYVSMFFREYNLLLLQEYTTNIPPGIEIILSDQKKITMKNFEKSMPRFEPLTPIINYYKKTNIELNKLNNYILNELSKRIITLNQQSGVFGKFCSKLANYFSNRILLTEQQHNKPLMHKKVIDKRQEGFFTDSESESEIDNSEISDLTSSSSNSSSSEPDEEGNLANEFAIDDLDIDEDDIENMYQDIDDD